jgi:hypothetical protein
VTRTPLTLVLLAAALVASACSSGAPEPTAPAKTTNPRTDPTASTSTASAPRVHKPLDATRLITAPCSSLTITNAQSLQIVNPTSQPVAVAGSPAGCTWSGDGGGSIAIAWQTADPHGLSDLYATSSTIAYWHPVNVAGYPAAYGDTISDGRSQGDCVLYTAVSDQIYFISQFDNPLNPKQSCALAKNAAEDVIANLQGAP